MEEKDPSQHLQDLQQIRSLMERSSRFISLSGFSGIFVGVFALLGVYLAIAQYHIPIVNDSFYHFGLGLKPSAQQWFFFLTDAALVLLASVGVAVLLSYRKASSSGHKVWDATARRLLINMMLPLATGGIFCIALLYQQLYGLVAPATLIFYGLALFNASKYTLNDIRYLGVMEIALGLATCFGLQYQLIFWAIGFGLLHIIYGIALYYKYER